MDNRLKTVLIIVGVVLLLYVLLRVRRFTVEKKGNDRKSEVRIDIEKEPVKEKRYRD